MEYQDGQLRATILQESLLEVESEAGWFRFQTLPSFYFREAYADGIRLLPPEGAEESEELGLSYLLTYHVLGLGDFQRESVYLTDAQGNVREVDNIYGQDFQKESQLYFPDLPAGDYTLHIPYLCWEGDGAETEISVPVPEPGERLPLD